MLKKTKKTNEEDKENQRIRRRKPTKKTKKTEDQRRRRIGAANRCGGRRASAPEAKKKVRERESERVREIFRVSRLGTLCVRERDQRVDVIF